MSTLFSFISDLNRASLFDVSTVSISICRKCLETEKGRYAIELKEWPRGVEIRGFKNLAASEGTKTIELQIAQSAEKSKALKRMTKVSAGITTAPVSGQTSQGDSSARIHPKYLTCASLMPNPHQLPAMTMYQDGIRGHIPISAPCPKALDNAASAAVSELRTKVLPI